MKKITVVLLGLLIIGLFLEFNVLNIRDHAKAGEDIDISQVFSLPTLQADFNQFKKIVNSRHSKYFVDEEELDALFDQQYQLLENGMTELEFYRILSPIVSMLRCGHTNLSVSESYEEYMKGNVKYLPLKIKFIDDRMYVIENLSNKSLSIGVEIVKINDHSTSEIVNKLLRNLTADGFNETKKYYIMNHWFNALYYYYFDTSNRFQITYRKQGSSNLQKVTLDGIRNSEMDMTPMNIYLNIDKNEYDQEFHEDYAVLTIKTFSITDKKAYRKFIDGFFEEVAEKNIDNLILDLRGNWGGIPYPSAYLLSYLIDESVTYFDRSAPFYFFRYKWWPVKPKQDAFHGNLYTLIDGASFSTTGHLISLLKYNQIGTFIGEESGGSSLCMAEFKKYTLKNTKLRFYCSKGIFKTTAQDLTEGRGIMPEIQVVPTLKDYINQDDVPMKAAVGLVL